MKSDAYMSTREAASVLGVALGTAQRMVDTGELEAWTTQGGHRRIFRESVLRAMESRKPAAASANAPKCDIDLLLANSEPGEAQRMQNAIQKWGIQLRTAVADDALDVAILSATQRPRIVLMRVDEPTPADIASIGKLQAFLKSQRTVLAVLTSRQSFEAMSEATLKWGTLVFARTPGLDELKGFVRAQMMEAA